MLKLHGPARSTTLTIECPRELHIHDVVVMDGSDRGGSGAREIRSPELEAELGAKL